MPQGGHGLPTGVAEGDRGVAPRLARWRRIDPVLAAITLAALALRAWGLGAQSLWYDEWSTGEAVDSGVRDLLAHVVDREGNPPPYFALVWLWTRLAGQGEAALRTVSLVAGVVTVPVVYALARELRPGRAAARVAALLVAVAPMLVWYSQEARPYALLALVGTASALAAVRALRSADATAPGAIPPGGASAGEATGGGHPLVGGVDRRALVLWAAACAAAVAVHYFAAFLVAAEAGALVAARRDRWRAWAIGLVPAGLTLLLLVPVALRQHSHEANRNWITAFSLVDRLSDAGRSALVGPSPPDARVWLVAATAAAVAVGSGWRACGRADRRAIGALAGVAAVSVGLALAAVAVGVDAVVGRYLIAALPLLVVAVAVAAAAALTNGPAGRRAAGATAGDAGRSVVTRALAAASVGVLVVASLVTVVAVATDPDLQRPDWRSVAVAHDRADGAPARRALVLNTHATLALPLTRYVEGGRALGPDDVATVEEIDVVVARPGDRPCNLLVGRACGLLFLGVPPPQPLFGRLVPDGRLQLDQFFVDRYRTDGPVDVTLADLVAPGDRRNALVIVTG